MIYRKRTQMGRLFFASFAVKKRGFNRKVRKVHKKGNEQFAVGCYIHSGSDRLTYFRLINESVFGSSASVFNSSGKGQSKLAITILPSTMTNSAG